MKHTLRIFSLLLITNLCLSQGNFIKDSLDIYIKREMARCELPGLALAIIKDGKVVVMKGYGYSDLEKKTPVTENTVFQIASNSKAFTGTALALIEHYGKINLNDKVRKYLDYFRMSEDWRTEQVTITDVLSHRIGFGTFQSDFLNWNSNRSGKDLVANMVNVTPKYGFREKYGYCNIGFVTAGQIIQAVTDTIWDEYLKHHFFIPLGMKNTSTYHKDFMSSPNASKAYSMWDGKVIEIPAANVDNLGPAGSITSCVSDLSKWVMMQLANGKYNGKQIVPEMVISKTRQSNMIVGNGDGKDTNFETYGLGWFLNDFHGKKVVTHDGGANGFLSKTVLVPEDNFGFVILTNSDAQYMFEGLGKQLLNDLADQPYKNYSSDYDFAFKSRNKADILDLKELRLIEKVYSHKVKPEMYKKLEGLYGNKVYGKITVEAKETFAEVKFEFHPQYKATIKFLDEKTLLLDYNDPVLGVHEINFDLKAEKPTIEMRVNDFVDMDPYLFTRMSTVVKPFEPEKQKNIPR